jgi:outer membrane PBP1 activator LpoA protein
LPHHPKQIALLLPLSGSLGSSGQAIQHGFLTTYYRSDAFKQKSLRVKTYDTTTSLDITAIYQQAVNEGADIVVGPLVKTDIQTLIDKGSLQVPTIALNTLDSDQSSLFGLLAPPDTLYQFGLSPRDEALQVALKAARDGKHKALVFVPNTEWGKGVFYEFDRAWQNQGGSTVEVVYLEEKTDLAAAVKRTLHITDSDARHAALDKQLGAKTKTIERRRDDIDMIMIAVKPDTARQLVPLFKFYYAGDLPVYATSRIYSGSPNDEADKDLNGVLFCDIPLLLSAEAGYQEKQQRLRTLWPADYQNASRLYALGADAYTLTQQLNRLVLFPLFTLNGDTGVLSVQNNRRIYRGLSWAKIRNGRLEVIE